MRKPVHERTVLRKHCHSTVTRMAIYFRNIVDGQLGCNVGVLWGCLRVPRDGSVGLAQSASVVQAVDDRVTTAVLCCGVIWLWSNVVGTIGERTEYVDGCLWALVSSQLRWWRGKNDAQYPRHGA